MGSGEALNARPCRSVSSSGSSCGVVSIAVAIVVGSTPCSRYPKLPQPILKQGTFGDSTTFVGEVVSISMQ